MARTKAATAVNSNSLAALRASMDKKYGKGCTLDPRNKPLYYDTAIPTGSVQLDFELGGGYIPGRVYEISGPESAGKSTMCIEAIANAQRKYPDKAVMYSDAENTFDWNYATTLGVDLRPDKFIFMDNSSENVELTGNQMLDAIRLVAKSGECSLIIADSLPAYTPASAMEKDVGESAMADQARMWSDFMRKSVGAFTAGKCAFIFVNHLKMKIGGMGNPETTPGGTAPKYAASARIQVKKGGSYKDRYGNVLGHDMKLKLLKNKITALQHRTFNVPLYYGMGIDVSKEVLQLGTEHGFIKKAGSWFSYEDPEDGDVMKLGQGDEKVSIFLDDNPELRGKIGLQVFSYLRDNFLETRKRASKGEQYKNMSNLSRDSVIFTDTIED